MTNYLKERNNIAIDMLFDGQFKNAQNIFIYNVKNYPCFTTLHNLGLYYYDDGKESSKGKIKSCKKLGLRYLEKANKYEELFANNMALGNIYYDNNNYSKACEYFQKACDINSTYISNYNLACTYFKLNRMTDSYQTIKKSVNLIGHDNFNCENSDKVQIYLLCAFVTLTFNITEATEFLNKLLNFNLLFFEEDIFALAFLTKKVNIALDYSKKVISDYHSENSIYAMIFDLYYQCDLNEDVNAIFNNINEKLEGYDFYNKRQLIPLLKIKNEAEFRLSETNKYNYYPQLIYDSYYIRY